MAMATRLKSYLLEHGIEYSLIPHPRTGSSMETAQVAHVPGDALAKGVVVEDESGYLLVTIPADYHLELDRLARQMGRPVELATEQELSPLFADCEQGAVPPIGPAYGLRSLWDPHSPLGRLDEVFFEAGDHEHLVRVSGRQFHELMGAAERGRFSHHV
jgi:Ala-tRNA(Pro) deacylase